VPVPRSIKQGLSIHKTISSYGNEITVVNPYLYYIIYDIILVILLSPAFVHVEGVLQIQDT